jgi:uncharacterized repeat protein (TIGR03803 family)
MTLSCLLGLIISVQSLAQPQLVGTLQYLGPQNGGSIFRYNLPATTPGAIYSFNNLAPHRPIGGLALGNADWVYGVLTYNGTNESGLLYKIKRDGTGFTPLHTFSGNSNTTPYYHTDGFIYFIDLYVIKKLDPSDNSITDVFSGGAFVKSLHIDADDWIYYTTFSTVEKVKTDGTNQTVLHTFNGVTEGFTGISGLTETPGDSIFGINVGGGDFNGGTLYSVKKDGSGFTVHHHFTMATGAYPDSKLVYFDGKLYGTTQQGGDNNDGVIYTIRPDGSDYRVIHHFDPGTPAIGLPFGNISITSDGRIFGMFYQHMYSGGVPYKLYKLDTSGANFEPFLSVTANNQRDYGHLNVDMLLTASADSIFLATQEMGRHEGGVLSKFDTLGNSLFGQYHFGYSVNGFKPTNGLIKGTDGKLYGTAKIGGTDGAGIVYSVNADGTGYTKLHEFTDAQGFELSGKLLEGTDGKLYGASSQNTGGGGTIFRINKNGSAFEIIHSFTDLSTGYAPLGSLIEDNTGALFGTTNYSTSGAGVVFKMNKDGSGYTVLKTFDGSEIYFPAAGLFVSGNYLYGACSNGGAEFKGGIFRIQKNGTGYQVLHEFNGSSDGSNPYAPPIIANNGKLYGTTGNGGTNSQGIVYSMDITGANYSILHNFSDAVDGAYSYAGVIQASDGLIYGTTSFSNIAGDFGGTIYKLNLDGSGFAVVKVFDEDTEGQSAPASLVDLQSFAAPVQWISFTANKKERSVLLTWKTAQEQSTKNFEVERSSDGRSYKRIGSIAAAGNSNAIKSYTYSDDQPLKGLNYYRLKQNDLDSKFNYSEVVSMNFDGVDKLLVFPNPARDQLTIQLPANSGFTSLHVLDASGKLVLQKQMTSGASKLEIDIRKLPAGLYILQLRGEKTIEQKFLKTGR